MMNRLINNYGGLCVKSTQIRKCIDGLVKSFLWALHGFNTVERWVGRDNLKLHTRSVGACVPLMILLKVCRSGNRPQINSRASRSCQQKLYTCNWSHLLAQKCCLTMETSWTWTHWPLFGPGGETPSQVRIADADTSLPPVSLHVAWVFTAWSPQQLLALARLQDTTTCHDLGEN